MTSSDQGFASTNKEPRNEVSLSLRASLVSDLFRISCPSLQYLYCCFHWTQEPVKTMLTLLRNCNVEQQSHMLPHILHSCDQVAGVIPPCLLQRKEKSTVMFSRRFSDIHVTAYHTCHCISLHINLDNKNKGVNIIVLCTYVNNDQYVTIPVWVQCKKA